MSIDSTSICQWILPPYVNGFYLHMAMDSISICQWILPPYVNGFYLHMSMDSTSICQWILPLYLNGKKWEDREFYLMAEMAIFEQILHSHVIKLHRSLPPNSTPITTHLTILAMSVLKLQG